MLDHPFAGGFMVAHEVVGAVEFEEAGIGQTGAKLVAGFHRHDLVASTMRHLTGRLHSR